MFQSLHEVREMSRQTMKKVSMADFKPTWKWVPARFQFYTVNRFGEEYASIHKPVANALTGQWDFQGESIMVGEHHEKPVENWMNCLWEREQYRLETKS